MNHQSVSASKPNSDGTLSYEAQLLKRNDFDSLFAVLKSKGYDIIAPTIKNQAICYGPVDNSSDLPVGWRDQQEKNRYSLRRRKDEALFGYNLGPDSWKKFLYPSERKLWQSKKSDDGRVSFEEAQQPIPKQAFLGVRACELEAIRVQDQTFIHSTFPNPNYKARREQCLIIGVNCAQAADTCFCTSMQTGPHHHKAGCDLVITEFCEPNEHYFILQAGSRAGHEIVSELPTHATSPDHIHHQKRQEEQTSRQMWRQMDKDQARHIEDVPEHARWDEVAQRCLSCANCTLVCPTCFCSTTEDKTDLEGDNAERWLKWDSCFTGDFTYIHGGEVRRTVRSRYRQWLTHKLSTWYDQFGSSGCVGCGRCITWCPVGIDLTEEANALTKNQRGQK